MAVSTSAFYAWVKNPGDTDRTRKREVLEAKARQLFYEHKQTYGYRRLSDALGKVGIKSGHYQVRHLMARPGLKARYPKRFKVATNSNHNEAISANSFA
jgi:putative transposase